MYRQREIVLVPFPYSDLSTSKKMTCYKNKILRKFSIVKPVLFKNVARILNDLFEFE